MDTLIRVPASMLGMETTGLATTPVTTTTPPTVTQSTTDTAFQSSPPPPTTTHKETESTCGWFTGFFYQTPQTPKT